MERFCRLMLVGCAAAALSFSSAYAQSDGQADSSAKVATTPDGLASLPPAPTGKSTIIGGEIRNVDPVLDQFTLKAYGQKSIKVFFDERTQIYRDGNRIPLRELGP